MIPYFWERIICLFRGHVIGKDSAVQEMAAVYHGGVCERCLRPVMGAFICNYWDDTRTVRDSHGDTLHGVNPILRVGTYVIRNWCAVQDVSAEILKNRKKRRVA